MDYLFHILFIVTFIVVTFAIGNLIETEHYEKIKERENIYIGFPAVTSKNVVNPEDIDKAELVYGSVVISLDYFKRFLASMRNIFGGRIVSYESLLDRGRREAVLRLKDQAREKGYEAILNLRFETSTIGQTNTGQTSVGCFEVLAYGTAVKYI